MCTVLPCPAQDRESSSVVIELNSRLRDLASKYGIGFFKLNIKFLSKKAVGLKYYREDGVHLNGLGMKLLTRGIRMCI